MTLRDLGVGIVQRWPWADGFARRLYSGLPARFHDTPTSRAQTYFAGQRRVAFIEIGAYDGVAGDPVRPLILANPQWSGVLVEPQPDIFARLRENYQGQSHRLQFLNVAISATSGVSSFYRIASEERERLALPDWGAEIASFDPDHLRRHFPQARIETLGVETRTFAQAATLLPGGRVDLVVLDVEGHERAILESIDYDRHGVRFLIFEHKHIRADDMQALRERLESADFELKGLGRDAIAWRSKLR